MKRPRTKGGLLFPVKTEGDTLQLFDKTRYYRRGVRSKDEGGGEGRRVEISQFHPSESNPFGRNNKAAFLKVSTAHRCLNFLRNLGY